MDKQKTKYQGRLQLYTELGSFLSDQRIKLLEAIAIHGSLNAAAKAIPISYKAAWEALDSMNNLSEQPLVVRATGGRNGGGTTLTPYAKQLITLFKAMESEYQHTLTRMQHYLDTPSLDDEEVDFHKLMQLVNFKSSARNQLAGKVVTVTTGAVNVIVELKVGEHLNITATITKASAEALNIEFGSELLALIKSTQVTLQKGSGLRTSANNQLDGVIRDIKVGAVCSEVSVELAGQKSLGVSISQESMLAMDLQAGDQVKACFNASAVILCSY